MKLLFACLSIITIAAVFLYWYLLSIIKTNIKTMRNSLEKEINLTEKRLQECDDSSEIIYWKAHLNALKHQLKKIS